MTYTKLRPEHLAIKGDPNAPIMQGQAISVMLDDGFTCSGKGRTLLTYDAFAGDWWFSCQDGRHFIEGLIATDELGDYYVGIFLDD
jgi:hypothetical protein